MAALPLNEQAIFEVARKLDSPEAREAYLQQACGNDAALGQRVRALLKAYEESASFLETPAGPPERTLEVPAPGERAGSVIGPYKLLQQIGEGGMGTVFMAEQTQPVHRRVALKISKPGMDTRQVIARFEAERQALAVMDHPNIAKVLDAGATAGEPGSVSAGRPYFVMELVKGVAITKYCDEHRLTPRQRLELFLPVCQAIQHAHQKGIIHRDVKPSNVLVAPYDGKPVVKVIDFGIAKATGQRLTEQTLFTDFGAVVGTLEYMSPEQAELNNQDIDTRSDIYSLGVLLYELLTGSTPMDRGRLKQAAFTEMLRMIREEEPPKPSTRLSESKDSLPSISAQRQMEPARLTRLVRGELDWITMKALDKDRNRRYETANGFAADVQRYLNDEQVQACPPTAGYRLRKLLRRNKGPVLAALLVLLTLIGGVIGTSWQAVRAIRERNEKQAALTAETQARRQTRQALDDMTSQIIEEWLAKQTELLPEHEAYLQRALASYEAFAADTGQDEEGRAGVAGAYHRVGQIRKQLGLKAEADAAYRKSADLYQQLVTDFPVEARHRRALAVCEFNHGILEAEWGSPATAELSYKSALGHRRALVEQHPTVLEDRDALANGLNSLGLIQMKLSRLTDAEASLREAIRLQEALIADAPEVADYHEHLAASYLNLGSLLRQTDRAKEAEGVYRRSLELNQKLREHFPSVAKYRAALAATYNNLANLLNELKHREDAEAAFREAVPLLAQLAADFPAVPQYRADLARTHTNRGILLERLDRPQDAEAAYRAAIALLTRLVDDFPAVSGFAVSLGAGYCSLAQLPRKPGEAAQTLEYYAKAIQALTPVVEKEPRLARARLFLRNAYGSRADELTRLEKHAEALKDYDHAVELVESKDRNWMRLRRAACLAQLGQHVQAVAEAEDVIKAPNVTGELLYNAAYVYATACKTAAKDSALREPYGARAVVLLQQAADKGYRDLANTKTLTSLHGRADYQQLLEALESKKE